MEDKTLISELGGPAVLARLLGYDTRKGGVQRVYNWTVRGIPASVKLQFPGVFLRGAFDAPGNSTAHADRHADALCSMAAPAED